MSNKKVNMSSISNKIQFIYGDECEKNKVGIIIFNRDDKFFFDPDFKNSMTNEEVEALLLRGAVVNKNGKYYRPSSFNGEKVSFSDAVINPEDIEVDLSGYITKDELDLSINKIKMIAHRGFSSKAPENTIPAYELAGMKNYWGAECDILETSDNHFVLMHDDTVDRTTNGSGEVSSMTLNQIKALTVDINADYNNLKVPTLEEYLTCCKKYAMVPIIEIKTMKNIQNFVNIIRSYGYEDSCVVISFDNDLLKQLRSLSSVIKIQTLAFVSIEECLQYNFDIDMAYAQVTKDFIQTAHENGLKVNVWTVNDTTTMDNLINMNIDYITTDKLMLPNQIDVAENLNRLEAEINRIYELFNNSSDKEIISLTSLVYKRAYTGEILYPTGYSDPDDLRAYDPQQIFVEDGYNYEIITTSDIYVTLHPFDENKKRIEDFGWLPNGSVVVPKTGEHFYIVYIKMADESSVKVNEDRVLSTVKIAKIKVSDSPDTTANNEQ